MQRTVARGTKHIVIHDDNGCKDAPQEYIVFFKTGHGFSQEVYRSYYYKCAIKKFNNLEAATELAELSK